MSIAPEKTADVSPEKAESLTKAAVDQLAKLEANSEYVPSIRRHGELALRRFTEAAEVWWQLFVETNDDSYKVHMAYAVHQVVELAKSLDYKARLFSDELGCAARQVGLLVKESRPASNSFDVGLPRNIIHGVARQVVDNRNPQLPLLEDINLQLQYQLEGLF